MGGEWNHIPLHLPHPILHLLQHRPILIPLRPIERRHRNVPHSLFDFLHFLLHPTLLFTEVIGEIANECLFVHTGFGFLAITIDTEFQIGVLEIPTVDTDHSTVVLVSFDGVEPFDGRRLGRVQRVLALGPSVIAPIRTVLVRLFDLFGSGEFGSEGFADGGCVVVRVEVVADVEHFLVTGRDRVGVWTGDRGRGKAGDGVGFGGKGR